MNDKQIREILVPYLQENIDYLPDTSLIHELGIFRGDYRIDIARVTQYELQGYEIKSEKDTLIRLPNQIEAYNQVFDRITIVASPRHIESILVLIPEWWGIIEVQPNKKLNLLRDAKLNHLVNTQAVSQLLWKDESLKLLELHNLLRGVRGKSRTVIEKRLSEKIPLSDIQEMVRHQLKNRKKWRV